MPEYHKCLLTYFVTSVHFNSLHYDIQARYMYLVFDFLTIFILSGQKSIQKSVGV